VAADSVHCTRSGGLKVSVICDWDVLAVCAAIVFVAAVLLGAF
jgi:hypothetical protein